MMGGGCTDFARCILVVFNIIFVFSGIGILSVGLWLKADPNSVNIQKLISVDNLDEAISSTAYVLVGFGSLVFLVGLLGCIGGWKQWKWALGMYIFFLVVIFVGEFSGGIMAAVYKSKLTSQLGNTLEKSIAEYKNNSIISEAWDEVQKTLHCCGVTTYMDYSKYAHFSNRWPIPSSCCAVDFTACTAQARHAKKPGSKTNYFYREGCLSSLQNQLKANLSVIIGVAMGIAMIQLIGICLACKTYRSDDGYPVY